MFTTLQRQAPGMWRSGIQTSAVLALCASSLSFATSVEAVPLRFDTLIGTTDSSNVLGPVTTNETLYFADVASENGTSIDAKISTIVVGDTNFGSSANPSADNVFGAAGYMPDYHGRPGGPEEDLGFLYYGNGINSAVNGITVMFEFFNGTGDLARTFTDSFEISEIELAIYDVDGESLQSEFFTAFKSDGLVSYATGTTPQALTATDQGSSVLFEGPNTNFSELDATGAALLNYENTSALTLEFGSVQFSGPDQNGVFSAIDGDASLFTASDFGDPVSVAPVPLPAGAVLLLSALSMGALLKRRQKA